MRVVFIFLFVALTFQSFAQRTIRFGQINYVQGVNNPAAIAIDGKIMVDLIGRNQWYGFEGAPTTIALNGQYEIEKDMAVGLNVYHDQIGVFQTTSFQAQYAYRLFTNYTDALIFGVGAGVDNYIQDFASVNTVEPGDHAFSNYYSRVLFNASMGIYYNSPNYYIGFSTPDIFAPKFDALSGKGGVRAFPHFYFSAGTYIDAGENFKLNPHLQVKYTVGSPIAGDLILRNTFYDRWSFVVGYRTENSIIAGFDILVTPYVRTGYSFNYNVDKLARIKGMSNELYLGVALPYHDNRASFGDRRYLKKGKFSREYKHNYRHKNNMR